MGLFETGFRIFISAMIISESAVDLGYLISQMEVCMCGIFSTRTYNKLFRAQNRQNIFSHHSPMCSSPKMLIVT